MNLLDRILGSTGQERTAALRDLGRRAEYYVPPELRGILGFAAEMTPTASLERAMQASGEMFAPGRTPMQRVGSAGQMLSETAGVVAPAAVARRAAMPAAQAVQEAFMGFSAPARAAGEGLLARANQRGPVPTMYSNPLRVFHGGKDLITNPRATVDPEGLLPGFSVTPDENIAGMYAKMRGGDAVSSFEIDEKKLNPIGEMELYELQNFLEMSKGFDEGDLPDADLLKELKDRGINAIKYDDPEFGIRVLDTSILKPSENKLPTPRNEAEAMAKQVLEMRAAGRAGDVTEEMMAATDPQYMFANTPLPMDYESRMARAAGRRDEFHGTTTGSDMTYADAFRGSGSRQGIGFVTSDNPYVASSYADPQFGSVFPMLNEAPPVNAPRLDVGGEIWSQIPKDLPVQVGDRVITARDVAVGPADVGGVFDTNQLSRGASFDYPAIEFSNISDRSIHAPRPRTDDGMAVMREFQAKGAEPSTVTMRHDTRGMRSRFARFDPAFAHLRNLSAGVGGLGLLSLMQQPQEPQ